MDFRNSDGQQKYDALVALAPDVAIGLDFDGTLSPIVDDPADARIHPDGPRVLIDLAAQVRVVVVITGRPAAQVVELGSLDEVADALLEDDRLVVMGQYGNEHWDSDSRKVVSPEPPAGLVAFRDELPGLLATHDAADAFVEDKGIALAVHTRRLPDPQAAFERLRDVLTEAADRHGLVTEPGRMVVEVRAPGMHKGQAVRAAVDEHEVDGVLFAGDDLGDLEAFEAVRELGAEGYATLLVCSGSEEQTALVERSDVVVDGPPGVLRLLASYAADAGRHAG